MLCSVVGKDNPILKRMAFSHNKQHLRWLSFSKRAWRLPSLTVRYSGELLHNSGGNAGVLLLFIPRCCKAVRSGVSHMWYCVRFEWKAQAFPYVGSVTRLGLDLKMISSAINFNSGDHGVCDATIPIGTSYAQNARKTKATTHCLLSQHRRHVPWYYCLPSSVISWLFFRRRSCCVRLSLSRVDDHVKGTRTPTFPGSPAAYFLPVIRMALICDFTNWAVSFPRQFCSLLSHV